MTAMPPKVYSLYKGQIFPNYKSLCEFLEEDIKTGSSKKAQQAVWGRWFSWDRDKHSYIIKNDCLIPAGEGLSKDKLKISKLARPIANNLDLSPETEVKGYASKIHLSEDMVFKNYGALCDYLQEDRTSGDGKVAQLRRWETFFSWENEKYSFRIKEVFRPYEPFSVEWRYSVFYPACRLLLLYIKKALDVEDIREGRVLGSNPSNPWTYGPSTAMNQLVIFPKHLYKVLGFHGGRWKKLKNTWYWETTTLDTESTIRVLKAVDQAGREVFRQELSSILENLEKRGFLVITKSYLFKKIVEEQASQEQASQSALKFYFASDEEVRLINLHKQALIGLYPTSGKASDTMTEYKLHQKGLAEEFYSNLGKRLRKLNMERVFPVLCIGFGERMLSALEELVQDLSFQSKQREEQNAKLHPMIEKRALKAVEKEKGAEGTQDELSYLKEILGEVLGLDENSGWEELG